MAVDTKAFGTSLGIYTAVCVVCFIIFSILRTAQLTRKYYAPKRYADDVKHRPMRLPLGFFGWIKPVWTYPEEEVIKVSGLDAAVFVRILRFGFDIFLWISVWCCAVILPINVTDNYVNELIAKNKNKPSSQRVVYSNIDKLYTTNISPKSDRLWAHAISVYIITFIVLRLLWSFNNDLSRLRISFMATLPKGGPSHTVLVTDLPGVRAGTVLDTICRLMNTSILRFAPQSVKDKITGLIEATYGATTGGLKTVASTVTKAVNKSPDADEAAADLVGEDVLFPQEGALEKIKSGATSKELVDDEFKATYGADEVVSVNPVYNQSALEPLVGAYDKTKGQLEDLLDHYESRLRRRKPVTPKQVRVVGAMLGPWGKEKYGMKPVKVDALEFYPARLEELKRQIREQEPLCKADYYPTSFVTFNKRYTQAVASTGLHSHDESIWKIQEAPGEEEIVWSNLRMRSWERTLRGAAMWALFVAMVLFYGIVCAAIQSLVNIKQLERTPVIKEIVKIPFVRSLLVGILPGLVLKIFLAILPMLLAIMNRFAGMVSISQIDFGVVERYFIFQFLTVFLVTAMSGTFLSQAKAIIKNPDIWPIIQKIANGIPQNATFFMTFVMLNGLAGKPIAFLRVVGLIIFWILSKIAATERAKTRLWANQIQMFGNSSTDHVMTILFGIVFCIQAPLICPICLYYFVVTLLIEKYQMIYVFRRPYESGGRMWAKIYRQIMVAVYVFQIVMILQLALKGFFYTPLVIPVFFLTLVFDRTCCSLFRRPWVLLSLRAAAELDRLDEKAVGHAGLSETEKAEVAETYLSPVFKIDEEEHAALMEETANVQRRIANQGTEDPEAAMPAQEHASASSSGDEAAVTVTPEANPNPLLKKSDV